MDREETHFGIGLKDWARYRLSKAIQIEHFETVQKESNLGNSSSDDMFGKKWFIFPDKKGRGYFKRYSLDDNAGTNLRLHKHLCFLNEILCSILCKQISLPCAEYSPARYDEIDGLLSQDLVSEDEEFFHFMDGCITLNGFAEKIDQYQAAGYKIDKQSMLENVFRAIVMRLIILDSDTNPGCFVFAKSKDEKQIRFSGMVDHDFAFHSFIFLLRDRGEDIFDKDEKFSDEALHNFINEYSNRIVFNEEMGFNYSYMTINLNNPEDDFYGGRIAEICKFAKENSWAMKVLKDVLQKLDVESAVSQMEQEGVEVDSHYAEFTKRIVDFGKQQFEKCLSLDEEVS